MFSFDYAFIEVIPDSQLRKQKQSLFGFKFKC